jgi:hypothetical protein
MSSSKENVIKFQVEKLYQLELLMMDETRLFTTLQETLQLISDVHKKSELSASPWVTFVGKDERFQTMLRRIASKPLVSGFPSHQTVRRSASA